MNLGAAAAQHPCQDEDVGAVCSQGDIFLLPVLARDTPIHLWIL